VGLPLSLVLGLVVILTGLPVLESSFIRLLGVALEFARHLMGA
jgi:flagellar biosynthesis protein FliR